MNAAEPATLDADALLQLERRLADAGRLFAVATVVRALPPTSTWVGAQALVEGDGTLHGWIGGGCARGIVIQAALDAMRVGQPKLLRISNTEVEPEPGVELHAMPCASNGTLELFIQPTVPAPVVLILGATPAALEAFVLARRMGLRAYPAARTPDVYAALDAPRVLHGFDVAALNELDPHLILVATQGDGDEEALEAALRTSAAGVLLIASARKAGQLSAAMRARGIAEERLAVLHAPAGPRIHARTPQEIALGAVAGLIDLRHALEEAKASGEGAQASLGGLAIAEAVPAMPLCESMASVAPRAQGTRGVNPVCGMEIDFASALSVVERDGVRIPFCCDGCRQAFDREPERYLAIARGATQREVV
ncbi:XdhC family protein [Burkholderia sp. IDO3]|uniref:XdhC family protein n=1 Tax=Burkholderia sp. IDO3 TaxID=1705310 RepID=UPI000BBA8033|nr:XdhC family protein [Burkholderia sp. IDO3]AXK65130.1 YHS domain-containing protein [Burkholderia sp. IDO3]PCD61772.1 sulfurylase large subunit [Burkholderia sp. IDO3]